jgi:chitodextrinase
LGNLTSLQILYLYDNQLAGEVPTAMTNLTGLTGTALGYNMLTASDPAVIAFLASKDPDWDQTQTVPPTNVHVDSVTQTSVTLAWTPILYTGHGGYYEVGYGTIPGGPYDSVGCTTSSKSATGCLVEGLSPGTTYYFAVRTFTPAHGGQQNDLLSFYGEELAVTTAPPPNTPPVADAGPDQTVITGETVIFDGSGSSDPDGTIVSYEWDFGDGATGSGETTTHAYVSTGTYTVILTVADDDESTDSDAAVVTVQTPAEAIQYLSDYVRELGLSYGTESSLLATLEAAIASLGRGQDDAAIHQLGAFINQVEALRRSGQLSDELAQELISGAQRIIDNI